MRLCINCIHYDDANGVTKCKQGCWIASDKTKSKIYNPMMFECLEYEGIEDGNNFDDDHLFDLFIQISR